MLYNDEGRPFGIGIEVSVSTITELLGLNVSVVNVVGTGSQK
ncbi:MAG TPA: hypothetical protein VK017_00725 [Sphingobacterium sp.]|nr:hypothetical protein [Sphingobacterium sp.]